ncbi:MAG: phosphate acyltransferase PlsX [Bdellovibrionales bacterium]|nr:phosphate acyltransferase PlsX [Bdellovibrionales bacterium]
MNRNGAISSGHTDLPIAVDASGGDAGIDVQVEGAVAALKELGVHSTLVGPAADLQAVLEGLGASSLSIGVVDAPETISMDESAARAVVKKPNSSLCVSYRLVKDGQASAIISSGNSGAMMAAGMKFCGMMPGIKRPAIATLIPRVGGRQPSIILDSGANVDCRAHNLVQFAIMGAIYCKCLFKVKDPRVALLSNGSEPNKGTETTREAAAVLSGLDGLNFTGYVEGREVASGAVDVVVCDGFVGNIVLKTMEGCVRLVGEQLEHECSTGFYRRILRRLGRGLYRDVFRNRFDYTAHGGAPLLGLRKLAIVLHGSSDARAVKNAIRVASTFAKAGMTDEIGLQLSALEESSFEDLIGSISEVLPQQLKYEGEEQ